MLAERRPGPPMAGVLCTKASSVRCLIKTAASSVASAASARCGCGTGIIVSKSALRHWTRAPRENAQWSALHREAVAGHAGDWEVVAGGTGEGCRRCGRAAGLL